MGKGQLADQFKPMAEALRGDNYDGVISFETQALDLKEKLTAGVLTSQDIFFPPIKIKDITRICSMNPSIN